MTAPGGRMAGVVSAVRAVVVAGATLVTLASCTTPSNPFPASTQLIAARSDAPGSTGRPASTPEIPPPTGAIASPEPSPPAANPGPPAVGIVPGSVNRSTFRVTATYSVKAAITVATGALEVATTIQLRNDSGGDIDRLELNTIAARLGGLRIASATVDDAPVKVTIDDQTLGVPLGGILPAGGSTLVRIVYRASLRRGLTGSDWMFSRSGGTIALYRWIPWVSRAAPFDRPNVGDPFVTPTSPQVDVELLTDSPMVLATPAPAADVSEVAAGGGRAWSFTVRNVRDVSIALAPDFEVVSGDAAGVPIRVYTRSGRAAGERLLNLAAHAIRTEAAQLGVAYPWPSLTVVETAGGTGLESPGLIWIPDRLDTLNRTYLVHHEVAHQWFYGLVGNDQQAEPFADEAAADLLARTVLGTLRPSRCGREALDRGIRQYSRGCYYEVIYVQGGLVLDAIRREMGTTRFWSALAVYLERYRFQLVGTKDLLETLREGSEANLLPILRTRFPTLY